MIEYAHDAGLAVPGHGDGMKTMQVFTLEILHLGDNIIWQA